jgi:hypothetical protein
MFSVLIEDPEFMRNADSNPMIPFDDAREDKEDSIPEMSVVTSAAAGYSTTKTMPEKNAVKQIRHNNAPKKKSLPKPDKKKAVNKGGSKRSDKSIRVGVKKNKKNPVTMKPVMKAAGVSKSGNKTSKKIVRSVRGKAAAKNSLQKLKADSGKTARKRLGKTIAKDSLKKSTKRSVQTSGNKKSASKKKVVRMSAKTVKSRVGVNNTRKNTVKKKNGRK